MVRFAELRYTAEMRVTRDLLTVQTKSGASS
jgi:hypothetical protein